MSIVPILLADLPALIAVVEKIAEAYVAMRAIAAQAGATDEQLADADAKFARYRKDPLGPVV